MSRHKESEHYGIRIITDYVEARTKEDAEMQIKRMLDMDKKSGLKLIKIRYEVIDLKEVK